MYETGLQPHQLAAVFSAVAEKVGLGHGKGEPGPSSGAGAKFHVHHHPILLHLWQKVEDPAVLSIIESRHPEQEAK